MSAVALLSSCGDAPRPAPHLKWIDTETSGEAPRARAALTFDLTDPVDVSKVRFLEMETYPQDDGVRCEPTTDDPMVFLPLPLRFNTVRIEMRSEESGFLEVFWSTDQKPYDFVPGRQRGLPVKASKRFETYDVRFRPDLPAGSASHHFRIDPLDRRASFTIRRISLLNDPSLPPRSEKLAAGGMKLGDEWRQAFLLFPGQSLDRQLPAGPRRELRLGAAAADGSARDLQLRVTFVADSAASADTKEMRLADLEVPVSAPASWLDFRVPLPRLRTGGRLRLAVSPAEESTGAVYVANPLVLGTRSPSSPPNVILLSLDTLGAGELAPIRQTEGTFFGDLERRALSFERAIAASSLTHVSHAALLAGRTPPYGDLVWQGDGFHRDRTLAEDLRRRGYATAAFTGGVMLSDELGFDKGFEWYRQADTLYRPRLERGDLSEILAHGRDWLLATSFEPFFLFLHSYEVHGPYYDDDAPRPWLQDDYFGVTSMRGLLPKAPARLPEYLRRLDASGNDVAWAQVESGPPDVARFRRAHRNEIRRADRQLAEFFATLEREGLLERTVVIVTSDHGEAFFQHGLLEHGLMYEENLQVPLFLWAPGLIEAGSVEELLCMDEVKARLLSLLDGDAGAFARLAEPAESRICSAYVPGEGWAWQTAAGRKLIWRTALLQEDFGKHELFDLARDPGELENLLGDASEIPREFRRVVRRVLAESPGVRLRFDGVPAGAYRVELRGAAAQRTDTLLAFGMAPLSAGRNDDEVWMRDVELAADAMLLVQERDPWGTVDLNLVPLDSTRPSLHFGVDLGELDGEPRVVGGNDRLGRVVAWRTDATTETTNAPRGFSPESEAQLRALGYIQ